MKTLSCINDKNSMPQRVIWTDESGKETTQPIPGEKFEVDASAAAFVVGAVPFWNQHIQLLGN